MLTTAILSKRDNYNYGESFKIKFDFEGRVYEVSISEGAYKAIKEECGNPILSGQFEQDVDYILPLNNCPVS